MRIDKDAYKRSVDETMEQMKSQKMYRRFVSLAGTSHISARNLAAVLHGNRDAEEVGTLQNWNKRNRIVMAKSKGVKILKPDPDNPKEFKSDLKTLLEKQILIKDSAWNVYVLGKAGVKLTNQLNPEAVRYKTKLFSRREEVGHDVLVYTAYKELEKEILKEGKQILSIKNDRQLPRSPSYLSGSEDRQGTSP